MPKLENYLKIKGWIAYGMPTLKMINETDANDLPSSTVDTREDTASLPPTTIIVGAANNITPN